MGLFEKKLIEELCHVAGIAKTAQENVKAMDELRKAEFQRAETVLEENVQLRRSNQELREAHTGRVESHRADLASLNAQFKESLGIRHQLGVENRRLVEENKRVNETNKRLLDAANALEERRKHALELIDGPGKSMSEEMVYGALREILEP